VTFVSVVVALTATGALSARLGGSPLRPAIIRLVTGGSLAMGVTFGIGALFNASVS
jgi:vacuolar iron transporter family protein